MRGTKPPIEDEKQSLDHLETLKPDDEAGRFSTKNAASIKRQIDFRLIPCLGLMYFVSLMDRKNVANAAIAGMRTDLDMLGGYRYSLMTLVFFITYVILQPPMTILCRKIGPRNFLPGICLLWGCVIIGFGFSDKWTTLVALRLILGIFEAGYFPGCVYLLSTWYTRCTIPSIVSFSVLILNSRGCAAVLGLLSDWQFRVCLFRNPCLWLDANGGCRGHSWLEMVRYTKPLLLPISLTVQDFHYGGRRKCLPMDPRFVKLIIHR